MNHLSNKATARYAPQDWVQNIEMAVSSKRLDLGQEGSDRLRVLSFGDIAVDYIRGSREIEVRKLYRTQTVVVLQLVMHAVIYVL